jgi:hypothetical protein
MTVLPASASISEINAAVALTRGDFICILEDGIELEGAWFMEMLGMMGTAQVGAVGQKLEVIPEPCLMGGIVLINRRAWQECGLFIDGEAEPWKGFSSRLRKHGYVLRQVRSTSIRTATT